MQPMGLLNYSTIFEQRDYADIDILVKIVVNQVYYLVKQITPITDDELALFMLSLSNIVF